MKILIIDNDWRFAQQATAYLESRAHLVVHQGTARETVARAEHWSPELVILSAEQADENLLRSLRSLKDAPAVLLTGRLDQYDRVWRAWQYGGHEILLKPVLHASELQDAMITALENSAAGVRTSSKKTRASA